VDNGSLLYLAFFAYTLPKTKRYITARRADIAECYMVG
jgi:hypothetical protein